MFGDASGLTSRGACLTAAVACVHRQREPARSHSQRQTALRTLPQYVASYRAR